MMFQLFICNKTSQKPPISGHLYICTILLTCYIWNMNKKVSLMGADIYLNHYIKEDSLS